MSSALGFNLISDVLPFRRLALVDGKIQVVEPTILDTTGAARSGTSTASDMAKFMLMLLNNGSHRGNLITLLPDKNAGIFVAANLNLVAFPEAVRAYLCFRRGQILSPLIMRPQQSK